jgi:hypothetical protein
MKKVVVALDRAILVAVLALVLEMAYELESDIPLELA